MFKKFMGSVLLLLICNSTLACSFGPGYSFFEPDLENFEQKRKNGLVARLSTPKVLVKEIVRGSGDDGVSCDDAGIISLTLFWPGDATYELDEIGFYFQTKGQPSVQSIFPAAPIQGRIVGNSAKFFFVWLDGHPRNQHDMDFELFISAVNKGLQIGEPQVINITANKG